MIKNLLLVALRNLRKDKWYNILNILGLTIGITFSLFLIFYIRDELTFDRFVPGDRNVYVLIAHFDTLGLKGYQSAIPAEMAAPFKLDFPQAKTVARYGSQPRTLTMPVIMPSGVCLCQ